MAAITNSIEVSVYTIAECLNEIIVNDDLDAALQNTAQRLSENMQIDCCYICCHGNSALNRVIAAGENTDYGPTHINTLLHPELHSILTADHCFKVSINNRISSDLQKLLQLHNLQSLLFIPVFKKNKFWGSIGFGDKKRSRTWHTSEVQLQSLATAMASAVTACYTKNEIEKSNQIYNNALAALNEIVWEVDLVEGKTKAAGSPSFIEGLTLQHQPGNMQHWLNEFLHEDDRERVVHRFTTLLADRDIYNDEEVCRVYNKTKQQHFWMQSRYKITRNAFGKAILVAGTSIDISDLKKPRF